MVGFVNNTISTAVNEHVYTQKADTAQ